MNWECSVIDANEPPWRDTPTLQRQAFIEWLREQRVPDPHRAIAVEYLIVDAPLINVTHLARDEHDRPYANDDGEAVKVRGDYRLRTPLPEWWRP